MRSSGVRLEPWITSEGIGLVAHASMADDRDTPSDLARRAADTAARALLATPAPASVVSSARARLLTYLDDITGEHGAAFEAFSRAAAPEHPAWIEPHGLWTRIAGVGTEAVQLRAQALGQGPLRIAVLANVDDTQGALAAQAVERWLLPTDAPRACRAPAANTPRPGRYSVRLSSTAGSAQALFGVPIPPPNAPGCDLAELTIEALNGPHGILASGPSAPATVFARIAGGEVAPTLIVDVRAPSDSIESAQSQVRSQLLALSNTVTEAHLAWGSYLASRKRLEARMDPRSRLADLWRSRDWTAPTTPTLAAWREFLAATFREPNLVVVVGRPE
jgi:hypothetical protein